MIVSMSRETDTPFNELRAGWESRVEDVIIEMQNYKQAQHILPPVLMDISKLSESFNSLMDSIEA